MDDTNKEVFPMKRKQIMTILALAFFAAVLAGTPLAAADCQKHGQAEKKMAAKGCGMEAGCMMLQKLTDLSAEQKAKLEKLHAEQQKAMAEAKAAMAKLAGEMQALLKDPVDVKKAEAKIDELAAFRAGMQKKHLAHFLAVRALLSDGQKAKLGVPGCMMGGMPGCGMGHASMAGKHECAQGAKEHECTKGHEAKAGHECTEDKGKAGHECMKDKAKAECQKKEGEEKK
jgi:Spy/CpxP family protein refolding chaperone